MVSFAIQQLTDAVNASYARFQIGSSREWCLHVSFSLKLPVAAVWCYASNVSLRSDCSRLGFLSLTSVGMRQKPCSSWGSSRQLQCQASMVRFRLLSHSASSTLSDKSFCVAGCCHGGHEQFGVRPWGLTPTRRPRVLAATIPMFGQFR